MAAKNRIDEDYINRPHWCAKIRVICRWVAWPLLAAIVFVTLSPIGWRPVTVAPADFERFAAFAVLGGIFCFAYPKHGLLILLLLVATAGGLEALQHLAPTRHGRIHDAAVKALGVTVGILLVGRLPMWRLGLFRRDV